MRGELVGELNDFTKNLHQAASILSLFQGISF
jgi:hypothetical protein